MNTLSKNIDGIVAGLQYIKDELYRNGAPINRFPTPTDIQSLSADDAKYLSSVLEKVDKDMGALRSYIGEQLSYTKQG